MSTPSLTIVFDNYPFRPGLTSLWGFAAVIRLPERTILFDTGSNGRVLLKNMAALGIDPGAVDMLFLSHPHWDHIGGLDSFLEANPTATVVLHEGFSKHLIRDLHTLCGELIVIGADSRQLASGIYSTGMLDSEPQEQALVIKTGGSTVAISGCAHPGMERIVKHANTFMGSNVDSAVGGFHLMYADAPAIERSIEDLQALGIKQVIPTHCSGDQAKAAFRRAYGAACIEGGVGREIGFDVLSKTSGTSD